MKHHPDIVLLVLDALRADRLSCYGYPAKTSPHLDAIAGAATLFTHAVAPAPWTVPTHASLFTGLYLSQHRMSQMNSVLAATLPTLAERLAQGGYFTLGISNNPLVGVMENGLLRGFSEFLNYGGLLTRLPQRDSEDHGPRQIYRLQRPLDGWLHFLQLCLARSSRLTRLLFTPWILSLWQSALRMKGNLKGNTPQTLNAAARLLIERPRLSCQQPVFIFINLMGTHVPYDPPRWAVEQFAPQLPGPVSLAAYLRRFNCDVYRWYGPLSTELSAEQSRSLNGLYDAEVAAQDAELGRFMEQMKNAGILDRILLIVTSDHGEHLGEKGLVGHGWGAYEEVSHVPLIVRDPSGVLPPGVKFDEPVSIRRLFHTILRAAEMARPAENSLALADRPENWEVTRHDSVVTEAEPLSTALNRRSNQQRDVAHQLDWNEPRRAIYHEEYKLIATGLHRCELFDLRTDPTEHQDLSPVLPDKASELRRQLDLAVGKMVVLTESDPTQIADLLLQQRLKGLGYLD